ncbi:MAG TPA: four helix bundle protein [Myxococcales bacterium]
MPNDNYVLSFQRLDVYIAAKEIARLVHEARITHAELRDQAERASVSCFLQLAEGLPNDGSGMRKKYFTESNNSLHELVAAVDLACTLGALSAESARAIQELSVRTKRMLRGLLNRRSV